MPPGFDVAGSAVPVGRLGRVVRAVAEEVDEVGGGPCDGVGDGLVDVEVEGVGEEFVALSERCVVGGTSFGEVEFSVERVDAGALIRVPLGPTLGLCLELGDATSVGAGGVEPYGELMAGMVRPLA